MGDNSDLIDGLEERLRNNSKAFGSILALTPAQEHYGTAIIDGRDPSEQWRAKKQTKAEKKAARKAKLDPANQKSVLDVMKEREKKRKRELGMEDDEVQEEVTEVVQLPTNKRTKTDDAEMDEAKRQQIAAKRRQKREKKKEKDEKIKAKREAKQARKQQTVGGNADIDDDESEAGDGEVEMDVDGLIDIDEADMTLDMSKDVDVELDIASDEEIDTDGEQHEDEASSAPTSPVINSPAFDGSANHSTTSSSSSILPPSIPEDTKAALPTPTHKPALNIALPQPATAASILAASESTARTASPKPQFPKIDQAILQERVRARIAELRAQRKADGADGQQARTRHELLEQRRKKAEQRKAYKKEQRRLAKEEEARKQEERLRGSGSPLSGADIFSPRSESANFSFSRLAFSDGTGTDASLSKLTGVARQKGPQDPKTALLAAENKQKRLSGLDEAKRADIGEKDQWLNASKRAHGERVRDDTSLLKKALKRKEKQKLKSEGEWQERQQAVVKGKEMKQKKREDNLAKRREEKGGGKKKSAGKKPAKRARPGFEGRFKA